MRLAFAAALLLAAAPAAAQSLVNVPRPGGGQTALRVIEPAKPPASGCAPTLIVSRGLGAGENALRYLSSALARAGYRTIVMRHLGAGRAFFQGRLVREGRLRAGVPGDADPAQNRQRLADLDAAHEFATKACRPPLLALGGHAAGSTTALIEAGAKPRFAAAQKNRFDAYFALSPQGVGRVFAAGAWAAITRPTLVVTGTRDPWEGGSWRGRLAAFDSMPAGQKRLAVLPGATHFALGGLGNAATKNRVVALVSEFLGQVANKAWKASAVPGVEIREK